MPSYERTARHRQTWLHSHLPRFKEDKKKDWKSKIEGKKDWQRLKKERKKERKKEKDWRRKKKKTQKKEYKKVGHFPFAAVSSFFIMFFLHCIPFSSFLPMFPSFPNITQFLSSLYSIRSRILVFTSLDYRVPLVKSNWCLSTLGRFNPATYRFQPWTNQSINRWQPTNQSTGYNQPNNQQVTTN